MNLELLLAMIQSGLGLVAFLILRGRRHDTQLNPGQIQYRERTWEQYKLLTLSTFAILGLNFWSRWMGPAWRVQHMGFCLSLTVFACLCASVWLVVSIPVLLRRYNYLTD